MAISSHGDLEELVAAIRALQTPDEKKLESGKLIHEQRSRYTQAELARPLGVSASKVGQYAVTYRQLLDAEAPMIPTTFAAWFKMASSPNSAEYRDELVHAVRALRDDRAKAEAIMAGAERFRTERKGGR